MGPQKLAIVPAAELEGGRHVGDRRQIDSEFLEQTRRIATDRDPGPISRSSMSCSLIRTDSSPCARPMASVRPPSPPPTIATSHVRVIALASFRFAGQAHPLPAPVSTPTTLSWIDRPL